MIAELVHCLDRATEYIQATIADLTDEEMTLQPPGVPNHAAWTVGHIVHSWQAIGAELGAQSWLPDEWESLFGYGTSPAGVEPGHHSRVALAASLAAAHGHLRSVLLGLDPSTLREPLPDADARELFASTADALLQVVIAHTAFHAGQLAAWRRAIGRRPVGVFI